MKKRLSIFVAILLFISMLSTPTKGLAVTLFNPYTGIQATPGETITYTINIENNESTIKRVRFSVEGLPDDWTYTITANGRGVKELAINRNDSQDVILDVNVPMQVEQAEYPFQFVTIDQNGERSHLPLQITLTEEGTLATEWNVDQPNLQGHTDSTFSYSLTLKNRTADEQNYALTANVPNGWSAQFKTGGDHITSIKVAPNSEVDITVDIKPMEKAEAGTYEIGIVASGSGTSAKTNLEAVITGAYDMMLTTPNGLLSTNIVAGSSKKIDLVIENTGTAPLTNVELSATTPPNWEVEFDTKTIPELKAGEKKTIQATITAADDAIAGDYVATFNASALEKSASATFRISVETSTLWGIVAISMIAIIVGLLYYIIRKYGRR